MASTSDTCAKQEYAQEKVSEIDSQLVPIPTKQSRQCVYPPGCPVLSVDVQNQTVTMGTVDSVFVDFSTPTRQFVYKVVDETDVFMTEEALVLFAPSCPVWAFDVEEHQWKECIVWSSYQPSPASNPLYSVHELATDALYHGVLKTYIRYRPEDVARDVQHEVTATLDRATSSSDAFTTQPSAAKGRAKAASSTTTDASRDDTCVADNEPDAIDKNEHTAPTDPRLTRRNEHERVDAATMQVSLDNVRSTMALPPKDTAKVATTATDAPGQSNTIVGNDSRKTVRTEPTTPYDSNSAATTQESPRNMDDNTTKTETVLPSKGAEEAPAAATPFLKESTVAGNYEATLQDEQSASSVMNNSYHSKNSFIEESYTLGQSAYTTTSVTAGEMILERGVDEAAAAATRRITNSDSHEKSDVNSVPAKQVLGDVTATHENLQEVHVPSKQGKEERALRNDNSFALVESSDRRSREDSPRGKRKRQERKRNRFRKSRKKRGYQLETTETTERSRGYQLETTDRGDSVSSTDFYIPLMGIFSEEELEDFDRRNAGEIMTTTGCSLRLRSTRTDDYYMRYKLTGTRGQVEWASNILQTYLIDNLVNHSLAQRALYYLGRWNQHREKVGEIVHQNCFENKLVKKWMYCDALPSDFADFSCLVIGRKWSRINTMENKSRCRININDAASEPHYIIYGDSAARVEHCMALLEERMAKARERNNAVEAE